MSKTVVAVVSAIAGALVMGVLMIGALGRDVENAFKRGQLDFQRGKVEWLLVAPDEVHHIQKEK